MLLVESDRQRRTALSRALRDAGFPVVAVERIAEIREWPANELVITTREWFTPWWYSVGAAHVIVLVDDRQQGEAACAAGASQWLDRECQPERLVQMVRELGTGH